MAQNEENDGPKRLMAELTEVTQSDTSGTILLTIYFDWSLCEANDAV